MSFIRYLLFFFGLFLFTSELHADEFVLISFKHRPEVTAAREKVMIDVNDRKCALIIIKTDVDLSNANFDANPMVCGSRKEAPGEWWVYVAPGSTKLQIKRDGFIPFDYFFPKDTPIESLNTYELRITNKEKNLMPEKEKQPEFVKIRSVPEGAKVYIDNQYKGQTPFDTPVLEGTYTWKIELDRYYTEEGEINVVSGNTPIINKTLKPRFGDIKVSSTPENGADIMLDGIKLNKKTPFTIKEVNSGTHKIELLLEMYEPTSMQMTVTDGQTSELNAELKPLYGEISIQTSPEADIYIDKVKAGKGNLNNKRLASGTHFLEAKKDNYTDASKTITVLTGTKESYTLEPQAKTGTLSAVSTPTDAGLYVDGILKGQTPIFVRNMLVGDYTVQIKKEGYGSVTKEISINESQTTELKETLPQGQQITIKTMPEGARIKVDGGTEQNTPLNITLSYGTHKIIALPPSGNYLETPVEIMVSQEGNASFIIIINSANQFTDSRDGKTYKTVKIGGQTWMAENLNYETGSSSWCYKNIPGNCDIYGRLYTWEKAKNICPSGWQLPSKSDFEALLNSAREGKANDFNALKKDGSNGFNAFYGGLRKNYDDFSYIESNGFWWTSTEANANAYLFSLSAILKTTSIYTDDVSAAFSVRCIKVSSSQNTNNINQNEIKQPVNSFTDSRDGKTYKTVKIGEQTWMADNLNYATNSGSWCYNNNSSNCDKYGRLYNYETAVSACPSGWRLPSKNDFDTLLNKAGVKSGTAFNELKKDGSSNFNMFMGGWCSNYGDYSNLEYSGYIWSSTVYDADSDWSWSLNLENSKMDVSMGSSKRTIGLSVRCIKGSEPSKPITEKNKINEIKQIPNSFTDARDGKTYKTVKIGEQTWMAENLNYTTSSGSWCYDNKNTNCDKYGRLYDWETARIICPQGWHLPSKGEFETLLNNLGGSGSNAYNALISGGSSKFNALFGGWRLSSLNFSSIEEFVDLWSSSTNNAKNALSLHLNISYPNTNFTTVGNELGVSVRCLKD